MHDSHIHLALEPLSSNIDTVVNNFISTGGKYILTQGTDLIDFKDTIDISKKYPETIHFALGLHPTFFEESTIQKGITENIYDTSINNINKCLELIKENIKDIKAIGETGLDYYQINIEKDIKQKTKEEIKEIQRLSFKKHINIAKENDLALSIHARDINNQDRCIKDVLNIVANEGKGSIKGCFHSYTGNVVYVKDILALGFHIGFNAIITYKSGEDVREILKQTPVERILFETDGPFLPPQSVRKDKKIKEKFAEPMHIREIMKVASEIKDIPLEKLEEITDKNYEEVFLKNH